MGSSATELAPDPSKGRRGAHLLAAGAELRCWRTRWHLVQALCDPEGAVCSVGSVLAECSLEAPVQAYGATGAQGLELLMWVRHLGRRDFCSLSSW